MSDPRQSRGFRNRNPGNIDYVEANKWQGQLGREPAPVGGRARFAVFSSHEYGIRALAALLTTYQDRHGLRTIAGIINRWAPPSDNNATSAYASRVARMMSRTVSDELNLHTYADLRPLVEAIITVECGGQPYPAATIDEGLRLFGVPRPVATVAEAATTQTGQGAISVGTVAAAAATAAPALQAVSGMSPWLAGILVAGAVVVSVLVVLQRRRAA